MYDESNYMLYTRDNAYVATSTIPIAGFNDEIKTNDDKITNIIKLKGAGFTAEEIAALLV